MKGVTGKPAVDAYLGSRGVSPVGQAKAPEHVSGHSNEKESGEAARVSISAEARARLEAGSHVDARKVEELKSKVADGSFQVDAHAVAKRMLNIVG